MKNGINKKAVILVNIISLVMLVGIILIKFLLNNIIFGIAFILWILFIAYSNYTIIVKNTDITEDIKAANKHHVFDFEEKALIDAYQSITIRAEFFEKLEDGDKLKETYELIRQQVLSNIKSAVQYMQTYDYVTCPSRRYIDNLRADNSKLLRQLSELVELVIKINSTADDIDLTLVDCMLESLRSVSDDN